MRPFLSLYGLLGVLIISFCLPAAASEPGLPSAAGDRLVWEAATESGGHQLTVGGASWSSSRVFPGGTRPELPLFDEAGQPLPDGIYTWSLELLPPPIRSAWDPANGRDQKPGSPPPPDPVPTSASRTGTFLVRGARLVVLDDPAPTAIAPDTDTDSAKAGQ